MSDALVIRLLVALACISFGHQLIADVKPPFGLTFGQPVESVRDALQETGAKVKSDQNNGDQILTVTGLPQDGLESALIKFDGSQLQAVELLYRKSSWNSTRYRVFFQQVRDNVASKFGTGTLVAKSQNKNSDGFLETVIGYEWPLDSTSVELYYYSLSSKDNAFFSVSLHYIGR